MGSQKKKSFVDRKKAVTYALLPPHDSGTAGENNWVRTDANGCADPFAINVDDASNNMAKISKILPCTSRDCETAEKTHHVLTMSEKEDLGLPHDGYDYSRHLRVCTLGGEEDNERHYNETVGMSRSADMRISAIVVSKAGLGDSARTTLKNDTSVSGVLRALDAMSYDDESIEERLEELSDDFYHLANEQIDGKHTPIAVHEVASELSSRFPGAGEQKSVARNSTVIDGKCVQDEAFLRIMDSYADEELGDGCEDQPSSSTNGTSDGTAHTLDLVLSLSEPKLSSQSISVQMSVGANVVMGTKLHDSPERNTGMVTLHDCESVLSLHSSSSYHPKLLECRWPRRATKLASTAQYNDVHEVARSVLANGDDVRKVEKDCEFNWRSEITRKGETAEQKKERKAAVKTGRRQARSAKKCMKETFRSVTRDESSAAVCGDVPTSVSVTKF